MYSPTVLPTDGWLHVEQDITAAGGERYLTIGNFDVNPSIPTVNNDEFIIECISSFCNHDHAPNRAYIYIDDVSVTAAASQCGCSDEMYKIRTEILSSDPATGCCYKVYLSHPSVRCNGDNHVCTIGSIVATDLGTNQVLEGIGVGATPIAITGGEHLIGTMCITGLSQFQHKDIQYLLRGVGCAEMCSLIVPVWGCALNDQCHCNTFLTTVVVEPAAVGEQECCYQLRLDGAALACDVYQVRFYEGAEFDNAVEVESARYTPQEPITNATHGVIHTFCVSPPFTGTTRRKLWVDFLDASGNSVCGRQVEVSCECDCSSTDATTNVLSMIRFEADPPGSCCFAINLENNGRCRFEVTQVQLSSISAEATYQASQTWSATMNGGELVVTPQQGSVSLHPGESSLLGRLCLGDCDHHFTGSFDVTATITADGENCTSVPIINSSSLACSSDVGCDDFEVAIWEGAGVVRCLLLAPSTWCVCCATIAARLDLCSVALASDYRIDIATSNGYTYTNVAVPAGDGGLGIVAYVCKDSPAETVTITLKHADGTILCSKTLDFNRCNSPEAQ